MKIRNSTALAFLALAAVAAGTLSAADLVGNEQQGKLAYSVCAGCHGADAAGNEAIRAPRLAGQFDWYIATQLENFKSGARGSGAGDTGGAMMQPMAKGLSEQTIADLAAYIASL